MIHAKLTDHSVGSSGSYGRCEFEPHKKKKKTKSSSLKEGDSICTNCNINRAICAKKTEYGSVANQLCVQCWEREYNEAHQDDPKPGGRVTKDGKFVRAPIKKGSVGLAVKALIDKVGIDEVTEEQMRKVVLEVKIDSKFNRNHFNWYKNDYRKKQSK